MSDLKALLMLAEAERDAFRIGVENGNQKLRRLERKLLEMTEERDRYQQTIIHMGQIMERTVNVLRGVPPIDCSWSTHDLAELAWKAAALANAALAIENPQQVLTIYAREDFLRAQADWLEMKADTDAQAREMIELMRQ